MSTAYLRRIDYDGPRAALACKLCATCIVSTCSPFPSRISTSLWAYPSFSTSAALYEKIVSRRRGGFCYELNGLFRELLADDGFRVSDAVSVRAPRGRRLRPGIRSHVAEGGARRPWLADVGFGESFLSPLQLKSDGDGAVNGHRYSVAFDGEDWELRRHADGYQDEVALYRFRDTPRQLGDYEEMSRYHQTSAESHFTQRSICSRAMPDGRVTLSGPRLIVTHDSKRNERILQSAAEIRVCLREHFAIEFEPALDLSPLVV